MLNGSDGNEDDKIPKMEDAINAGGKYSIRCTLILTEGESAKALAVIFLIFLNEQHFLFYYRLTFTS